MGETVQVSDEYLAKVTERVIAPTRAYVEKTLRERAEIGWITQFDLSQVLERAAWAAVQEFFRGTDQ